MAGREGVSVTRFEFAEKQENNHPPPTDLEEFLPWACGQLELPFIPVLRKSVQSEHGRANSMHGKGKEEVIYADSMSESGNVALGMSSRSGEAIVYIDVIYDNTDNVIQLKFKHARNVPVALLKLLSLIIEFHPRLTSIYINQGLNESGLHQVNKIVRDANVTEITLDNTVLDGANYYILLDGDSPLKYLSLARCKLNDASVQMLVSKLYHPSKASKTLSVLNISSNRITDDGAKYLGEMLRSNRKLTYLNLSNNMIADVGAENILGSLTLFRLTVDDISRKRVRKFNYSKEKTKIIQDVLAQLRLDYEKKYTGKKKNAKLGVMATKKTRSVEVLTDADSPLINTDNCNAAWQEKAETTAVEIIGPFRDPFSLENTMSIGEDIYCYGNNTLCYLNLAYNNLSYFSIKKMLSVLNVQQQRGRKPKGLINVCLEGNNLPESCNELAEIDALIDSSLTSLTNSGNTIKKKMPVRK